ncbi:hypothetical protein DFAR_3570002 [Desulfarculales bacterium]
MDGHFQYPVNSRGRRCRSPPLKAGASMVQGRQREFLERLAQTGEQANMWEAG